MNISTIDNIRIESAGGQFLDISNLNSPYGLEIQLYSFDCFWALIEYIDGCGQKDYKIILWPDKLWFEEWFESLKIKPKIILSKGKVGKEKQLK